MKLRLPKLLLLAVMTAGVSNVYAANGWGHAPADVYYIDNENPQSIDATGQTFTTWKIWSDTASSDNSPTNTTITSLKFKNGDTAIIELGVWDNSRNFDTITFNDVSIADNGTATLNVAEDNKAAIVNVSGGTISSTVDGSLSVTGQVAMNNLTLNGTLTNTGTLTISNLTYNGNTINNTGGNIIINEGLSVKENMATATESTYTEDVNNGYFRGTYVVIEGGDINVSQDILDADSGFNYDAASSTLTYTGTGTIYYLNTIEKEYDAGDNWNRATGFNIGSQGTLKLSAALASTMTDGITVSETGAKIKVEQGLTLNHSSVSIESGQKVSYELDGATLDLSKQGTVLNIHTIDMKNEALVKMDGASDTLGSANSSVQINMSGASTLNLSNGGGKVYANINIDGSANINGSYQGNELDIIGSIIGTGELTLGRPDEGRLNAWKISAAISDKSSEEKLSITSSTNSITLSGDNSYSGGTTITGGTLKATHANALGTGNVTVNGGNLEISGENAVKGAELNITNGKVTATFDPNTDKSVIKNNTLVNINTGGTLHLKGHDMLGWGDTVSPEKINLASDDAAKKATLQIEDTGSLTLRSAINMKGNAQVTGNDFNTFGTTLTVTGTGNEVSVGTIKMRTQKKESWDIDVAKGGELTISGTITNYNNEAATLNKSNEGKLIITGTESTWTGLMNVTGGTLQLKDNATLGDASIMIGSAATLEAGKGTINSLTLSDGATLKADEAVNMGGALTLGTNLTLNGSLLTALNSLTAGQTIDLFTGVESLTLGKYTYAKGTVLDEASGIDLSIYFSLPTTYTAAVYNAEAFGNSYYLGYNADGTIYAGMAAIPEPTTATLSLLALAALASRRRRK